MALDTTGTILTLRTVDISALPLLPLYSARGLHERMRYNDGAMAQDVTVNGELVDLSLERFRKLEITISAKDVRPPSIDVCRPGLKVLLESSRLFSYPTLGGMPGRTPVSGSEFTEGDFTFYRPTFVCMLGNPSMDFDEWEADDEWSLPMREV